ncbi:MAG TPA: PaaI family thioesterase [Thermoanaerobaculia bacterium]|nr:PaaI family thioesterase [Thermoanaerobaculia bacterium]
MIEGCEEGPLSATLSPAMTFQASDPDFAVRVRKSFARQGFMRSLGAELAAVEPGFCEIRLPFREDLGQQHGLFHAGTLGAIADSAGGYAAYTLMGGGDSVLSVEYKLNLLAPGRGELAIARARVVRPGRTLTVCQVEVFVVNDTAETLCALMQQTVIRMADRPDVPPAVQ